MTDPPPGEWGSHSCAVEGTTRSSCERASSGRQDGTWAGTEKCLGAITDGGIWGSATRIADSVGLSGSTAVSCTGIGECTAVGYDGDAQTNLRPIYSAMVIVPTITGVSPTSGPVGTLVTIKGSDLDGATKVTVNGVSATATKDTATKVKITVPVGATTGKIKVFTPLGKATTATAFTVT